MLNERKITRSIPMLDMECRFLPETINEEYRTVEMVFTTSTPVRMFNWDIGEFIEVLSMKEEHIRWDRFRNGAPLLNSHWRVTLNDQIGVVEKAWVEGEKMRGIVRFSTRKDVEEIFQDVKAGIIRNVSIGYRVHKYEDATEPGANMKTLRAIDWEPVEVSLVPVPADPNAGIRSEREIKPKENEVIILLRNQSGRDRVMTELETKQGEAANEKQAATTVDVQAEREAAVKAERQRMKEIRQAVRAAALGDDVAEKLIDEGKTADEARAYVLELLAQKSQKEEVRSQHCGFTVVRDEGETLREGIVEAIRVRAGSKHVTLTEKGKQYRYMKLLDMARLFAGRDAYSMSPHNIVQRAMSTSDFPAVLMDAINKELQAEYAEAPQTFDPIVRRVSLSDFKPKYIVGLGDFPELKKKNELGEIERGLISDGKEWYKLDSYAREVMLSRETIINDDMDAFSRLPQMAARRAREKESDLVWALINNNPVMSDGEKLFSSAHANTESAASIDVTNVGKLVAKMRKQKGRDGAHITIRPSWLIVPVALETVAGQFLSKDVVPTKDDRANPWKNIFKGYITDPRLDDNSATKWYIAADKADIDIIELGTLEGQGPQINIEEKFGTGVKFQIVHDIGAGLADYRGLAGNGSFA